MKKNEKDLISKLNESFKNLYDCGFCVTQVNLPIKELKILKKMEFKSVSSCGKEETIDVCLSTGKEISYIVKRIKNAKIK